MTTTADMLLAREAIATHIYLCEDALNHAEGYRLLDAYADVAYELGKCAERTAAKRKELAAKRKELAEQYRRADGSLDLPKPGSQYGARLDAERSEAMKGAR